MQGLLKRLRTDYSNQYDDSEKDDDKSDHDDDDDVVLIQDAEQPKLKDKEEKKAEAVEKAMETSELKPYYNRYILLMRDQRLQKKTFTEEQLHQFIIELFHSLQYKNDQSDGKISRRIRTFFFSSKLSF
jgi:hypothetical protein